MILRKRLIGMVSASLIDPRDSIIYLRVLPYINYIEETIFTY